MPDGKKVALKLRETEQGGIPWSIILDSDGKSLVNADGPKGNIGCPVEEHEQAWFNQMLHKTKIHCSDDDLSVMKSELQDYAKKLKDETERRMKEFRAKREAEKAATKAKKKEKVAPK